MSGKNAKTIRRITKKMALAQTRKQAEAQIRELWAAPFFIRLKFALRVIFRR
jgi:hypothetical protein